MEKINVTGAPVFTQEGDYAVVTFESDKGECKVYGSIKNQEAADKQIVVGNPLEVESTEEKAYKGKKYLKVKLVKKPYSGGSKTYNYPGKNTSAQRVYKDLPYEQYMALIGRAYVDSLALVINALKTNSYTPNQADSPMFVAQKIAVQYMMAAGLNAALPESDAVKNEPVKSDPSAEAFEVAKTTLQGLVDTKADRKAFEEFATNVGKSKKLTPEQKSGFQVKVSEIINK